MNRPDLPATGYVVLAALLSACTPPASQQSGESGSKSRPDKEASAAEKPSNAEKGEGKSDAPEGDEAPQECCIYCVNSTPTAPMVPCGDTCKPEGEACEAKSGCACPGEKRQGPKFKKGQLVRGGLIAADVPTYNAAQGDPVAGLFGLEQAFKGDAALADRKNGKLTATFETSMGKFDCELFEEQAPYTVANFVGLARGTRPFYDKKKDAWIEEPFFDGVLFHRVVVDFMIQTGDRTGTGSGGPGYFVPDEFVQNLRHNKAGILSMANRNEPGPDKKLRVDPKTGQHVGNTGSSQFFVTVKKTPHLDDKHTVFGVCDPEVATKISKVAVKNQPEHGIDHRPLEDVKLVSLKISRKK